MNDTSFIERPTVESCQVEKCLYRCILRLMIITRCITVNKDQGAGGANKGIRIKCFFFLSCFVSTLFSCPTLSPVNNLSMLKLNFQSFFSIFYHGHNLLSFSLRTSLSTFDLLRTYINMHQKCVMHLTPSRCFNY